MSQDEVTRKLAAIFSTDVQGYSRLMGDDEIATVQTLKAYRDVMTQHVQRHRGRVVDSPGDNLLAEFPSVVEAVQCAVEIQQALHDKNRVLPPHRRMEFRIGINLGDVIEDGDRLYGDGINIAARMEGLATGGGICISGTAYDQVENKLALSYDYLGEQEVKNIVRPVRVYRVGPMSPSTGTDAEPAEPIARPQRRRHVAITVIAGILLAASGVVLWRLYMRPPLAFDMTQMRRAVSELPGKASIAVLPFANLSADPAQEYFSDGITNDIITDLSKFRELFVIASNTVFTYKGKAVNIADVGRELSVRYVLEGSVQRMGEKVRINAQLIDAKTGHHLWAERYDRALQDLFAVQDEMIHIIVTTLALRISAVERQRAMRKDTNDLKAYDYVLRGLEYLRPRTRASNYQAREMFRHAIERDPLYAMAYVGLGQSYQQTVHYGWTEFPAQALNQAFELGQKALSLDTSNAYARRLLGVVYLSRGQYALAGNELQNAIALNPNDGHSYGTLGWIMLWAGQTDEAIEVLKTAIRFDPTSSEHRVTFMSLGLAYYLKGHYVQAVSTLEKGLSVDPEFVGFHIALAATYAQADRLQEAAQAAETVLRLQPFFAADTYGTAFRNSSDRMRIISGLRKAGLK